MPEYRRAKIPGGTYFFTVNTFRRKKFLTGEPFRIALRDGIDTVRTALPFTIMAWVLMPDHLHCVWRLPEEDADYSRRWAIIKSRVGCIPCTDGAFYAPNTPQTNVVHGMHPTDFDRMINA